LPQRELVFEIFDPLRLLGVFSAQSFILLTEALDFGRGVSGWRCRLRRRSIPPYPIRQLPLHA
jgi:hypothetical protein